MAKATGRTGTRTTEPVGTVAEWIRDVLDTGVLVARRRRRTLWWGGELVVPAAQAPLSAASPAVHWLFQEQGQSLWGVGEAARWQWERGPLTAAMAAVASELAQERDLPRTCRLGGGRGFWAKTPGGAWRGFPAGALVLPALTVRVAGGSAHISLAVQVAPETSRRALAHRVHWPPPPPAAAAGPIEILRVHYAQAPDRFEDLVADALRAIDGGRLDKVVLARSVQLTFNRAPDPGRVWQTLAARSPESAVFLLRAAGAVFLGASPELLVRVDGPRVDSVSLAGTAGPGRDPRSLLDSAKDREEHEWVRRHLAAALAQVGDQVVVPDQPAVRRVGDIHHLYTPATAFLQPDKNIWDALAAIHPSPAVGGAPAGAALRYIAGHEGFDRGWYAGAVGSVDLEGSGAFWVALRSGLLRGDTAVLYGGVGVVSGSDPRQELEESSWKLLPMLSALAEG